MLNFSILLTASKLNMARVARAKIAQGLSKAYFQTAVDEIKVYLVSF